MTLRREELKRHHEMTRAIARDVAERRRRHAEGDYSDDYFDQCPRLREEYPELWCDYCGSD